MKKTKQDNTDPLGSLVPPNISERKKKLDWEKVREIRRLYNERRRTISEIAMKFDTEYTHIKNIVNGYAWKE